MSQPNKPSQAESADFLSSITNSGSIDPLISEHLEDDQEIDPNSGASEAIYHAVLEGAEGVIQLIEDCRSRLKSKDPDSDSPYSYDVEVLQILDDVLQPGKSRKDILGLLRKGYVTDWQDLEEEYEDEVCREETKQYLN